MFTGVELFVFTDYITTVGIVKVTPVLEEWMFKPMITDSR